MNKKIIILIIFFLLILVGVGFYIIKKEPQIEKKRERLQA